MRLQFAGRSSVLIPVTMSASLPSTLRLKGWVTTANGLAWKMPYWSAGLRPVQVTETELPLPTPVRTAGERCTAGRLRAE